MGYPSPTSFNGEFKRGFAPLLISSPFPLTRGRGIKGDRVEDSPLC
jgi:hypothetical protein